MAIADSTKIDLLLKKLYGVTKTDTAGNKSPSNEAISSPLLIRGDTIWTQANSIPSTASSVTGIVESYLSTSRIACVADTTSQTISGIYPTWKTNLTNWISPEFDTVNLINTYRVKVYYGNAGLADPASSGGTQIFADGSGNAGEWYFDYQSGVLHFLGGTPPTGMTGSHVVYIYGYRYIGSTTINNLVAPTDTNISLTTSGTGIVEVTTLKLMVNGEAEITGDLTIGGNLNLGNQDTDTITVTADFTSNLVPDVASTYDLGALGKEWLNVYADNAVVTTLSNGTITLSGNTVEVITEDTNLILEPNGTGRLVVNTTTAITIPVGTELERPNPANVGDVRFNTDSSRVENYNGEQWNTMTNEDDAIAFAIALG